MDFRRPKSKVTPMLPPSFPGKKLPLLLALTLALALFHAVATLAQSGTNDTLPTLRISADRVTAKMPATFYGLMTEEIHYSYEGGLHGEDVSIEIAHQHRAYPS